MVDPFVIPVSILLVQFRGGNKGQKTEIRATSTSNLWMHHKHRNPYGKQLGNLMRPLGNPPELRVFSALLASTKACVHFSSPTASQSLS